MKYYIATSRSNVLAHHWVRDEMNQIGHELIFDWTVHGSLKPASKEHLREVAIAELNAIEQVDFIVVLLPGGAGTHLELGFAIASKKKIFLHSEDPELFELGPKANGFYHHPDVTCLTCPLGDVATLIHSTLEHSATLK